MSQLLYKFYSFLNKSHLNNDEFLSSIPELFLPMTEKNKNPKVIDIIEAINIKVKKITKVNPQLSLLGKTNHAEIITPNS